MKTIVITGSTDGIGKLAALKLAKDGHNVILHGRNVEKLKKTVSEIKEQSGNENIDSYIADLSDSNSIQKMIAEVSAKHTKIDVLINNAGVFKSNAQQSKDGLDLRFAVNYFAPYLLTKGMFPLLKKSETPRIINLSSAAQSSVSMEALKGKEVLTEQVAYAQSKLALTMWSFAFSKDNPDIVTIAVNPGSLLNTKMVQEAYGQHWASADKGADILYKLAVSKRFETSNGKYFDNDHGSFNNAHDDAYDQQKITVLLSETEKILNG